MRIVVWVNIIVFRIFEEYEYNFYLSRFWYVFLLFFEVIFLFLGFRWFIVILL